MNKKKLLVADDSVAIRTLITALMETEYHIVTANDGAEAVQKAVEEKPDLILMDIMMPNMDGIQATLQLKQNAKTKDIPVIMLTALSDSDSILTSYDYGADHYLVKPFDREALKKAIAVLEKPKERGI
jgi:CheY-like chemotaxis protein